MDSLGNDAGRLWATSAERSKQSAGSCSAQGCSAGGGVEHFLEITGLLLAPKLYAEGSNGPPIASSSTSVGSWSIPIGASKTRAAPLRAPSKRQLMYFASSLSKLLLAFGTASTTEGDSEGASVLAVASSSSEGDSGRASSQSLAVGPCCLRCRAGGRRDTACPVLFTGTGGGAGRSSDASTASGRESTKIASCTNSSNRQSST